MCVFTDQMDCSKSGATGMILTTTIRRFAVLELQLSRTRSPRAVRDGVPI